MNPCDCSLSRPRWTSRERLRREARVWSDSFVIVWFASSVATSPSMLRGGLACDRLGRPLTLSKTGPASYFGALAARKAGVAGSRPVIPWAAPGAPERSDDQRLRAVQDRRRAVVVPYCRADEGRRGLRRRRCATRTRRRASTASPSRCSARSPSPARATRPTRRSSSASRATSPTRVDPDAAEALVAALRETRSLPLAGRRRIAFDPATATSSSIS